MLEGDAQTCVAHAFSSDDSGDRQAKISERIRVFDGMLVVRISVFAAPVPCGAVKECQFWPCSDRQEET